MTDYKQLVKELTEKEFNEFVAPFLPNKQRYVNERAFAWEDRYRRLVIR